MTKPCHFNVYCDESCHLEHDDSPVPAWGAVTCPAPATPALSKAIRALKATHGLGSNFEANTNPRNHRPIRWPPTPVTAGFIPATTNGTIPRFYAAPGGRNGVRPGRKSYELCVNDLLSWYERPRRCGQRNSCTFLSML